MHVEWLPYGVNPVRGDAFWSLYRGCIHAFDYMEPHDPTRVLPQYGFRQCHAVGRIPPLRIPAERRPEDPKAYSVTYYPCDYEAPGAIVAVSVINSPSVPSAKDGNVEPRVMAWYLARTHPYILPSSLEAAAAGSLSGAVSIRCQLLLDTFLIYTGRPLKSCPPWCTLSCSRCSSRVPLPLADLHA
ncbi:hypothetical protein LINGRAHAP2_LOCUS7256 [Linum grandiflorum]